MTITYEALREKIEKDLDIEEEEFVQTEELMAYFNDAIRQAEAHIHKLGLEDIYFLNYDTPSLVSGTADYAMPTDIYLNKIINCVYNNGSKVFEVKELKGSQRFVDKALIENDNNSDPVYQYLLKHATAAAGTKWVLIPESQETSTYITRWYIRKAQTMASDASVCDLPEVCYNFLYAYVTWRVWAKEGDGRAEPSKMILDEQRDLMISTLAEMTPDSDNQMEMDLSSYDDMS